MRSITHVLLATVTTGTVVVASTGFAAADTASGGADNVVQVVSTTDGGLASRAHLQVAHDPADTVANQNIAVATGSNCTGCRTVAVAMQVVMVEGQPSTFVPANAAVATNANCMSCQTYAFAYQYVLQPGRMVHLSASAQQELASLRARATAVASSNESVGEIQTDLDTLWSEFVGVVDTEMQANGAPATGTAHVAHDAAA